MDYHFVSIQTFHMVQGPLEVSQLLSLWSGSSDMLPNYDCKISSNSNSIQMLQYIHYILVGWKVIQTMLLNAHRFIQHIYSYTQLYTTRFNPPKCLCILITCILMQIWQFRLWHALLCTFKPTITDQSKAPSLLISNNQLIFREVELPIKPSRAL